MEYLPLGLIVLPMLWTLMRPAEARLIQRTLHRGWPVMRPIVGWLALIFGVIGIILPVLNGIIFLMLGAALIGPRHPVIRRSRILYKGLLRTLCRSRYRPIRWIGRTAQQAQRQLRTQMAHLRHTRESLARTQRRFRVALVPGPEVCKELNRWRRLYDPAFYVELPPHILIVAPSYSLHRDRIEEELTRLCAQLKPFTITLQSVAVYEDEHRLIARIGAGHATLDQLRNRIAALKDPSVRVPQSRSWPGITLGRLRRHRSLSIAHAEISAAFQPLTWQASELVLFEERFGSIWHQVHVFPFAAHPST